MIENVNILPNTSTEEKIKETARRMFTKKGYAATKTRDIADESGINIALLNYYFRSKENLYELIMIENMQLFIHSIIEILNNKNTTFREKIEILISHYIDMLIKNPDLPMFVFNEINANPQNLIEKLGVNKQILNTYMLQQWQEYLNENKIIIVNPMHLFMNTISLTIFPFAASPMIKNRTGFSTEKFNDLMQERKKLIPEWIFMMIKSQNF